MEFGIWVVFEKPVQNAIYIKIWQDLWQYIAYFLKWEIFQTEVVKKIKT